jgi:DNA-directed RNA polymerase subunit F
MHSYREAIVQVSLPQTYSGNVVLAATATKNDDGSEGISIELSQTDAVGPWEKFIQLNPESFGELVNELNDLNKWIQETPV